MLTHIKTIVTRSPARLAVDASGALLTVALFAMLLHLPEMI